jgi:hypothetical protein
MGEGQSENVSATQDHPRAGGDPTVSYSLLHSTKIGRYTIVRQLGEGGFGQVFLAYDEDLGRSVAIKVPNPDRISRTESVEAFLAEARILASLDHPHTVPVYDVGRTENGQVFVVSKFIEGSDLRAILEKARPSFQESAALVAAVAEALHYAHTRGLVHRDIKPGNILMDASGRPFVADFGLALKDEDFGRGGGLAGTVAYMSPEQARGEGSTVDGRSDIFSLGIVFYELLTGRRPFRADTDAEVLERIATTEPRPPRQIDDTIPEELEQICLRALSKRVSDRYTTALDFATAVKSFLERTAPRLARSQRAQGTPRIDWVTFTRQQVESDALPPVCMACGGPATERVCNTFSYRPDWVKLLYLLAIVPGVIADCYVKKEMRVACPMCRKHRNHWRKLYWAASIGWVLAPVLGGVLAYIAWAMSDPGSRFSARILGVLGADAAVGAARDHLLRTIRLSAGILGICTGLILGANAWLGLVLYVAGSRISVINITNDDITLKGVADGFVRAAKDEEVAAATTQTNRFEL